jgi:serine/threonine protein phosphatase 1
MLEKTDYAMQTISSPPTTTCVIGDIHGCHAALTILLEKIGQRADTIVLLGDYVDRGPDSKEVVTTILALQKRHPRVVPLMGNHDFLFLQYLTEGERSVFLQVGGLQTLASYGLHPASSQEEIRRVVPPEHLAFFRSLPLLWQDQHAIYVHAGLQPGRHLSQQTSQWCLWARDNFLHSRHTFEKPVVFGHTVFDEPYLTPNKIGIDTGAVYGGHLTALLLPSREVISVPTVL